MAVLLPLLVGMTIIGTHYYRTMQATEPDCYPDEASPWSLVMSLSLGWFLSYIYLLLGCTALYNQLDKTRIRYFFRIFTHIERHDPLLLRLAEADQEEDERQERWNDAFEPLNQNGEADESFVPLTPRELSCLVTAKADKTQVDEVCSICCDNFEEKQKIRKMPACEHVFHKQCIDKWLQKKPICPNCNRNVRTTAQLDDIEDYLL